MPVVYDDKLKTEYASLFSSCIINPAKIAAVDSVTGKINANKSRYQSVSALLNIPWYVVAVIHNMEGSLNFTTHLHNGDPLTARTKHVPAGRPIAGNPPFTWEESACDALRLEKLDLWKDWSVPGILYKIEGYNGWGYRLKHPQVLTPYLWSFSNHYTKGKYVADGTWSDSAVSGQCGAAVILKRMGETGIADLNTNGSGASITPAIPVDEVVLQYSASQIPFANDLQAFLNKFPGIQLTVDGKPGKNTSDAFRKIFGVYLKGDPKNQNT